MTAVAEETREQEETTAGVGAVNPETQKEVAKVVKPGKPKAQAKAKKPSWRQRKKELEAARAAAGAVPVKQVVKTAKPRKPRTVAVKAKIKKRAGDRRRGPLPAEVSGLVAKKKELQAQIDGLDAAIKAAVLALRAAKGKA